MFTGDAEFCQRRLSQQVLAAGNDYFWAVKENQPTLYEALRLLFATPPPGESFPSTRTRDQHGNRHETRTLETSTALNEYLDWPGVGQVCRVERIVLQPMHPRRELAYAITSLSPQAASPRRLLALWRGHWGIENRLHWVRDVTFDEDRCQVRTQGGPQVLAALRNTAINALRRARLPNIAAALRRNAAHPAEALALIGLRLQQ